MLLNETEVNSIKQNKVTLIKNFIELHKIYDFNFISKTIEENDFVVESKTNLNNLRNVFQIRNVIDTSQEFKTLFDFLSKLFKYQRDAKDSVDLFISFVSQVGRSHIDEEDVFIIGLKGNVIYRVFDIQNKDYSIEEGDMIFIPKGLKHKVIGISPRIIASIGLYGERT